MDQDKKTIRQKKLDEDIPTHWYHYVSSTVRSRNDGISSLLVFGRDNKTFQRKKIKLLGNQPLASNESQANHVKTNQRKL